MLAILKMYVYIIFVIVMSNTEFIQIEARLLKVNAGVQHSKCLANVCQMQKGLINVWSIIVIGNNHLNFY